LQEHEKRARFERLVLPHLDAAYNLAVWLVRDDVLAEEALQEACLRAFRYFDNLRGEEARPWLLGIVRNTSFTLLQRNSAAGVPLDFDEDGVGEETVAPGAIVNFPVNPEVAVLRMADREMVQASVRALPVEFREAVCALPGRYRLDPLDDRRRVVPEVAAAYLTLNEAVRNERDHLIDELMRVVDLTDRMA